MLQWRDTATAAPWQHMHMPMVRAPDILGEWSKEGSGLVTLRIKWGKGHQEGGDKEGK